MDGRLSRLAQGHERVAKLDVRFDTRGLEPQRMAIVDTRITEILSHGVLGPVTVKAIRGKPTVYVGAYRLITVYPRDARNAGMSCSWQLAKQWAESTAKALPIVMPAAFMAPLPAAAAPDYGPDWTVPPTPFVPLVPVESD